MKSHDSGTENIHIDETKWYGTRTEASMRRADCHQVLGEGCRGGTRATPTPTSLAW